MDRIKIVIINFSIVFFISFYVFSQSKNYDFIYSKKGIIYTYNINKNEKKQITNNDNKIGRFIISNSKNKIVFAIYDYDTKLNQLKELNLKNKKTTILLEDKVNYNPDEDVFGVDTGILFTPLAYDPDNENYFIYYKNGVKAINNKKSIDLKLYDKNIFGWWGTGTTSGLIWKNNYLLFEGFGHEMFFQYLFKKENDKFINLSENKELLFGGFFEQYIVTGFYDSDIIIINNLDGVNNLIIFYDLKKMKKIKEMKIEDTIIVKPFGKELYSMNIFRAPRGKNQQFYIIDNGKKYLINDLKKLLIKEYLFNTINFYYDSESFLLYGILWDGEKETSFLYAYNILNNKFYYIDSSVGSFYKIENKQKTKVKLKSKVNNLRVRKSFDLKSEIITNLKKEEQVEVLSIGKLEEIDNITDNWIKIRTEDNTTGWCFKGYMY